MVLYQGFCHRSTKASKHAVFLHRDNPAAFFGCLQHCFSIERLKAVHIEHSCLYAVLAQLARSFQAVIYRFSGANERQVFTLGQADGFADGKVYFIVVVNVGYGITAHTNVHGMRIIHQSHHQAAGFINIGRQHYMHTGKSPQHGNIVQTVVC